MDRTGAGGVNYQGTVGHLSAQGETQKANKGQGLNRGIQPYPGEAILQRAQQRVEISGKTLSVRTVEVMQSYDQRSLGKGAGGVESNSEANRTLKSDLRTLNNSNRQLGEARRNFDKASADLTRLRSRLGWSAVPTVRNGLRAAEGKLISAEQRMTEAQTKLASAQNKLDADINGAASPKSALEGFYTPQGKGKVDRQVLEVRQQAVQALTHELNQRLQVAELRSATGDYSGTLEVSRIGQQLAEVGMSKVQIGKRLGGDKKFYPDAQATPKTQSARSALNKKNQAFAKALGTLGRARLTLDKGILSKSAPIGSSARQNLEKTFEEAERQVSRAGKAVNIAEENYVSSLKEDRKLAGLQTYFMGIVKGIWNNTTKKKAVAKGPRRQAPAVQRKSQPVVREPHPVRQSQQVTSQQAVPQSPVPQSQSAILSAYPTTTPKTADAIKASITALKNGRDIKNGREGLETYAKSIQDQRSPKSFVSMVKTIEGSKVFNSQEKNTLRLLINARIYELIDQPGFAAACKDGFIHKVVKGFDDQKALNILRIDNSVGQ